MLSCRGYLNHRDQEMKENVSAIPNAEIKNRLNKQQKRDYYTTWRSSGISKRAFCKKHGLPINSLYSWHKLFKKEAEPKVTQFSPVVAKTIPSDHKQTMMQIEMRLSNQIQLFIPLRESNLVSFIQELSNAVTIIR